MAEARKQGRASPRLEEACRSSMLTLEADEGARLREEGDGGAGLAPCQAEEFSGGRAAERLCVLKSPLQHLSIEDMEM